MWEVCSGDVLHLQLPRDFPLRQLCGPHNIKRGGRPHTTWPIDQLPYYKVPGYAERVQARLEQFPLVRTQALEQVTLVDKAIEELTEAIENVIGELLQYRNKTIGELRTLRTELDRETETALEEVERTLVEDQPQLTSRLGSMFRGMAEHLQPLELFSYRLSTASALTVVTFTSQLHLSQVEVEVEASRLASVTESSLRFFDFQNKAWKRPLQLNPHIQADSNSRWVALENGSVFICGGYGLNTAYIVGDGWVEQGRMCEARYNHGVLVYSNHTVYVFGGAGLSSCEKYSLQRHTWTLLQSMEQARQCFNPCLFNGSIYLYGRSSSLLEAFSPILTRCCLSNSLCL